MKMYVLVVLWELKCDSVVNVYHLYIGGQSVDLFNNSGMQHICAKSFGCVVDIYLLYVHTSFGTILVNIE